MKGIIPAGQKGGGCTRRDLLRGGVAVGAAAGVGALAVGAGQQGARRPVWQIDSTKCVACGRCATECVLTPSAVKCVHAYDVCGYCDLCGGFHQPDAKEFDTAAENQICPTAAIKRTFIEDPYYEYTIEEPLCIGCGICVKGCGAFGNGSLYLQVRHDRCVNCHVCRIAEACPSKAFVRVPADSPYLLRGAQGRRSAAEQPADQRHDGEAGV